MKPTFIFHAFWVSIIAFSLWSCSRPSRPTTAGTTTIIAETITITTNPSLALPQNPALTAPPSPTLPLTKEATATSTSAPSITSQPTTTRTATITPVPTVIPTITPTFDAYHLATATRSPAEVCPEINPNVKPPDFEAMDQPPPIIKHFQQDYLDYFNNGGIVGNLLTYWQPDYTVDLTNDGVSEYVFQQGDVFIFGCESRKYQLLLDIRANEG